jgi:hypothetical protein
MMNESPALTEGIKPRDPTKAAAPSLDPVREVSQLDKRNSHDKMSPYKLGATITSKTLQGVKLCHPQMKGLTEVRGIIYKA